MKRDLHIGDETITLVASAATDYFYFEIFRKDFRNEMQDFTKLKGKKAEDYTEEEKGLALERTRAFAKLAFVMKLEGENKPTSEIENSTKEEFYDWLRGFESDVFEDINVLTTIIRLYNDNSRGSLKPKNA